MSRVQHNPEYAEPVPVREPSPVSSIGSAPGPDMTNDSDREDVLSQWEFERKWSDKLELRRPMKDEEIADLDPLIVRPTNGLEERLLHERVMKNLRAKIAELEDEEVFEQTLLRGSQVGEEEHHVSEDIDAIMQSMLLGPSTLATSSSGPWNHGPMRFDTSFLEKAGAGGNPLTSTAPPPAAKRGRPKGRSRK